MAVIVVGPPVIVLTQNTPPASISFKQSVILSTLDLTTNNNVIEGYVVSGPSAPGLTVIPIAGTNKFVIPISTSTGNGSPYLKVHMPTNPTGNTLYVTYCVASNKMIDGFYDYLTGVPTVYFNALRTWINTNPINGTQFVNAQATLRARSMKFSFYGSTTNQFQNSVTFYIKFQGTFGTGIILGGGGVLGGGQIGGGGGIFGPS